MIHTPSFAIVKLPSLLKKIDAGRARLADEADDVSERWDGIGRAGGQREDHAAALLSRLRPHLEEIARLCGDAAKAIDQMVRDPFERNGSGRSAQRAGDELPDREFYEGDTPDA